MRLPSVTSAWRRGGGSGLEGGDVAETPRGGAALGESCTDT